MHFYKHVKLINSKSEIYVIVKYKIKYDFKKSTIGSFQCQDFLDLGLYQGLPESRIWTGN